MKKPFCVMYISHASDGVGGSERSMLELIQGFGGAVRPIIILPREGKLVEKLEQLHITYYIVPILMEFGKPGFADTDKQQEIYSYNFKAAEKIAGLIAAEEVELVHINSSVSLVGAMAAVLAEVPYVWHIREFLKEDFGWERYDDALFVKLAKGANRLITISDAVKRAYEEKYGFESYRIYNGIDIDRYYVQNTTNRTKNNILLAGSISKRKGQMTAIKAIKILVEEGFIAVKLFVIGTASKKDKWVIDRYIKKYGLEDNIILLPFMDNLAEFRNRCAYSITTSYMEAMGRVTLEAMLAGNLVIGSDTGGTLELIGRHNERGILYRCEDELDLARVIKTALLMDSREKSKIIKRAQEHVKRNFSAVHYGKSILEIYQQAISEKKDISEIYTYIVNKYELEIPAKHMVMQSANKIQLVADVTDKWTNLNRNGVILEKYFEENCIQTIAIYGMGDLGIRLYEELEKTQITVACVVDKYPGLLSELLTVKKPREEIQNVDAIILTVVEANDVKTVKDMYVRNKKIHVLCIKDIINELFERICGD